MALNRVALDMLEQAVVTGSVLEGSILKLSFSNGTTVSIDLSNLAGTPPDLSSYLTKLAADQLYQPLGGTPVGTSSEHGYVEYMVGSYTFVAQSSGVFISASAGGGGGAMNGLMGLSGTTIQAGGRGQSCTRKFVPTTVGASYAVIVGAPGSNNAAPLNGDGRGSAGGITSFDTLLSLSGGGGAFAPYYYSNGPYDGTSFGSISLMRLDVTDPNTGLAFGCGGSYVLNGFDPTTPIAPGRGYMIIEW